MVLVVQSGVVCIPAQLPRLVAYVTGLFPAVLIAVGEQGCCEVKRTTVGGERWCTAGCAADWPEIHGEL
jgi:hypothetical protein